MNILIVEDELLIAKVYSIHLKQAGHTVCGTFTNEKDTLNYLSTHDDLDLIIMDVQLKGGGDGVALTLKIHETKKIPVIFTTGNPLSRIAEQTNQLSNVKLLIKPVDPNVLLKMVSEMKDEGRRS
jgi:DNA-binding NtrC family response regulator